jgi:beta-glucosidase-like glycosyl hydrolase
MSTFLFNKRLNRPAKNARRLLLFSFLVTGFISLQAQVRYLPEVADARCTQWVDSVLSRMSLSEKLGQTLIVTIPAQTSKRWSKALEEAVKKYHVGGILFGHGTAEEEALLTNMAQKESKIPLLITFDGEWGPAMRLKGMPDFPVNASLGCIQEDSLIESYGREVARELKMLGVQVNFSPDADININPKNPVINTRSFGENPKLVADKVAAYSRGLESGGLLSVSKHFPGHGDTDVDSHKALPLIPFSRQRLDSVELVPFRRVIADGLGGIMVGHLQVPALESNKKLPSSLSHAIVTDLLKNEMGFKGLIFTDALEMKGVSGVPQLTTKALLAGNDMLLAQRNLKRTLQELQRAVKDKVLSKQLIDERCRKILTYKYLLGLRQRPAPIQVSGISYRVNNEAAQTLAIRLHRAAVVTLDNRYGLLPLSLYQDTPLAILSVGGGSDSLFVSEMERTVSVPVKHFTLDNDTTATAIAALAQQLAPYQRIIVSAAGKDTSLFPYGNALKRCIPAGVLPIYTFFTSYRTMQRWEPLLKEAGAVILAHSPFPDVQHYTVDILQGKAKTSGRLSMSIGTLYKAGDGSVRGER